MTDFQTFHDVTAYKHETCCHGIQSAVTTKPVWQYHVSGHYNMKAMSKCLLNTGHLAFLNIPHKIFSIYYMSECGKPTK